MREPDFNVIEYDVESIPSARAAHMCATIDDTCVWAARSVT
jgi:hypothetical protein